LGSEVKRRAFELIHRAVPAVLVLLPRGFVEELFVNERKHRAAAVGSGTVTCDSRSGVDRHAQVKTSFSFGTTSRYVPLTSCCSPSGDRATIR
jgi:hypothetical protein